MVVIIGSLIIVLVFVIGSVSLRFSGSNIEG